MSTTVASISGRLLRALLGWAVLWGAVLTLALWLALQHEVDELMDDTLQASAEELISVLRLETAVPPPSPAPASAAKPALQGEPGEATGRFVWQWVSYAGTPTLLRASSRAPTKLLHDTASAGFADVAHWRVYGVSLGEPAQMLYVAQTRAERSETRQEMALAVLLATLPMAVLALIWLRLHMGQELQPLAQLSQRLAALDLSQPQLRPLALALGPAQRRELEPVHAAIDTLGTRLARRVAQERAFAAHAAHALRTPLAGIDAQLAVALREAPAALQPRLLRTRQAAARLQHVVAALLTLFRSGTELERRPVALPDLAARLPVEGLRVEADASSASLQADADLLIAALINLLDNSLRYGATEVRLSSPAPGVLRVQDNGPGVSAERLSQLALALADERPDAEAADNKSPPIGLGLSLAALVARAHGGSAALVPVEHGLAVELRLKPSGRGPNE